MLDADPDAARVAARWIADVERDFLLDWPAVFVEGELAKRLAGLRDRASHTALLAWLLGRGDPPELGPW